MRQAKRKKRRRVWCPRKCPVCWAGQCREVLGRGGGKFETTIREKT